MIRNLFNIEESVFLLKRKFEEIKKRGWIKKTTPNTGEAGLRLENLLNKDNNNLSFPDFEGIEVKTKKESKFNNYITLFNCTPYGKDFFEIKRIVKNFGYPDKNLKNCKILNGDVFANSKNKIGSNYYFQLKIDMNSQLINLLIFNRNGVLIDNSAYWDFKMLKQKLYCKIHYLAIIKVNSMKIEKREYYRYSDIKIYELKSFEDFLKQIETGNIKVSFGVGLYKKGNRLGQLHDRGTKFRINIDLIEQLYNLIS